VGALRKKDDVGLLHSDRIRRVEEQTPVYRQTEGGARKKDDVRKLGGGEKKLSFLGREQPPPGGGRDGSSLGVGGNGQISEESKSEKKQITEYAIDPVQMSSEDLRGKINPNDRRSMTRRGKGHNRTEK